MAPLVQYSHKICSKCQYEAWVLVKVKVHTGYVPDCENTVPEWTTQWWCLSCVQHPIAG